ncbi:MAG: extracellular solute-binding protein family 3 [Capsulimonas sp.]|nr:extracellular solute-binding protein family 3 [Capsulimonas sp.]
MSLPFLHRSLQAAVLTLLLAICCRTPFASAAPTPKPAPAGQASAGQTPLPPKLRVSTRIVSPFVMKNNAQLTGFSTELWASIADELHVQSVVTVTPDIKSLLGSVSGGKTDLGIAAISITSDRDKIFDFSQPIYDSGLQIMVRDSGQGGEGSHLQAVLKSLFSQSILQLLGFTALIIVIAAHVIWLVERHHPNGVVETKSYFPGIFKATWWAAGVLGTQMDEMPKGPLGRFVAIVWIFVSVIFVAYFTAEVTTALTVQQLQGNIHNLSDLPGKRIGTVGGSSSATYLREQHYLVAEYPQIADVVKALQNHKVDAVVYDAPVLQYYASHDGKNSVQVVGSIFRKEDYGIVFPANSPYRKPVNQALLTLKENGEYDKLYNKWFSSDNGGEDSGGHASGD